MLVTSSGTNDSNGKQCASSCLFRHLRMCRYTVPFGASTVCQKIRFPRLDLRASRALSKLE